MVLSTLDWWVLGVFVCFSVGLGAWFARSAGRDIQSFFLGNRNLPWWIAGTSMVATTFAADTPLLITELVANYGISGNWIWWNGLIGGMLTVFFFARLWHKADILTDVELTEIRYSGKEARFLRGFRALYLGIFLNAVIIAWVNVALGAILTVFFDIPPKETLYYVAGAMLVVAAYSSLSGLLGVAFTDFFQFWIAMGGTIVLAFVVLQSPEVGGISGLQAKLPAATFQFLPQLSWSSTSLQEGAQVFSISLSTFLAYVGFQWWASWYPGAEPGGGGYVAQRMMSAKSPTEALKATLWFQIAHYAVRPLPWVLVALAAMVLYPDLAPEDKKLGYVMAMKDFLPSGLRGLLLAAFLAAYMSTISTQLNWGTGYLINDVYARFIAPQASARGLVLASRLATFLVMAAGLWVTAQLSTMEQAFKLMIQAGAGLGGVLILRWYWWRVNAWSEIAATLAPFVGIWLSSYVWPLPEPYGFFFTVAFTTVVWLLVTYLTPPTDAAVLQQFYARVRPEGWWEPIRLQTGLSAQKPQWPLLWSGFLGAMLLAYSLLFALGKWIFAAYTEALCYTLLALVGLWLVRRCLQKLALS